MSAPEPAAASLFSSPHPQEPLAPDDLWRRRAVAPSDILMREIEEESVLLNLNTGRYFGLDAVGTRMWTLLTAAPSVDAACTELLAEYDAPPETLRRDVAALIAQLVEHGLLELRDP